MKKGDKIYIKSTVRNLPVANGYSATVLYVRKVLGEERSVRVLIDKSYSFSRGVETNMHKATFSLTAPAYQFFIDKKEFIKSIHNVFDNFEKIIKHSRYEIDYF